MYLNLDYLFDKKVYQINLLDNHASFKTYNSNDDYNNHTTNQTILSEGWKIVFKEKYDDSICDYLNEQISISDLKDIIVPLSLELQGYGKPYYKNMGYVFDGKNDGKIGEAINVDNPVACYLRDLYCSKEDLQSKVHLDFKGFETALYLYINNIFVGYSENLYLDSEFDITPFLHEGLNRIGAFVFKFSTATWFLDQDFTRFSGIFRDVCLLKYHEEYIEDVEIKTEAKSFNNNEFSLDLSLKGNISSQYLIEIFDDDNKIVLNKECTSSVQHFSFSNVKLWSAEIPNLYRLKITLANNSCIETSFGFKDVRIKDSVLYFNNKRLIINGINRHEWNHKTGRCLSLNDMIFDAKLFKNNNINAVRTCHYPDDERWYELCDQYGIYMLDEACLETHGSWARITDNWSLYNGVPGNNEEFSDYCVNKILRMYERDKNHPSIFMFSLGNEAGSGDVFLNMYNALKQRNKEVIIHYEGIVYDHDPKMTNASDVYSRMYLPPKEVEKLLKEHSITKPFIHCEYEHAMGNSNGNIQYYRELIHKYQQYVGGFIWDYIDQGLLYKKNNKMMLTYGGDYEDIPNDASFNCNGIIFADRKDAYRSPKLSAFKYYYQPIRIDISNDKITFHNDYLFKSTKDLSFVFQVLVNGKIFYKTNFKLTINPGKSKIYKLPSFELSETKDTVYQVLVFEENNTNSPLCQSEKHIKGKYVLDQINNSSSFEFIRGCFTFSIKGDNFQYLFSLGGSNGHKIGGLISLEINGEKYLSNGIKPTIFRPTTDNDLGNKHNQKNSNLLSLSYNVNNTFDCKQINITDEVISFKVPYFFGNDTKHPVEVEYEIFKNGTIHISEVMNGISQVKELSSFGLTFEMPAKFKDFIYYGKGPFESYPDRKDNLLTGIYRSTIKKELLPYIRPQACGNHEDVRYLEIKGEKSSLLFVNSTSPFKFTFLPNSDFEIENATHYNELPYHHNSYLNILGFTRGVGGDDSWGAKVYKEFSLSAKKKYAFDFYLVPKVNK